MILQTRLCSVPSGFQTTWLQTQEQVVFSKHTIIYISHMSREHLKENQLII